MYPNCVPQTDIYRMFNGQLIHIANYAEDIIYQ